MKEICNNSLAFVKQQHRWSVPLALLLGSHIVFYVGGLFGGVFSAAICVVALQYHAKS